jgi:hypothetical protein
MRIQKGKKATIGSRAQVYHGTAKHTSGGLEKKDLFQTSSGHIVSRKKHFSNKNSNNLTRNGYRMTLKGEGFGFHKIGESLKKMRRGRKGKSRRGKSRKMRGGVMYGDTILSPASYDSK